MVAGPGGLSFPPNLILALVFGGLATLIMAIGAFTIKHWAVWITAALCVIVALAEFSGMLPAV